MTNERASFGVFSFRTRAGIYGIISAMENGGAKIKVPTTSVFDFPRLILGGEGKYVDKVRGGEKA